MKVARARIGSQADETLIITLNRGECKYFEVKHAVPFGGKKIMWGAEQAREWARVLTQAKHWARHFKRKRVVIYACKRYRGVKLQEIEVSNGKEKTKNQALL